MTRSHHAIDEKIAELRRLIGQAVRDEQLRHQLSGLPNRSALDEQVQQAIELGKPFWLAFIEIDRFKQINDQFGYDLADVMLKEVGALLAQSAPRCFASQAIAFHAHGDEFYLLGPHGPTAFSNSEIHTRLDTLRLNISQISIPAGKPGEVMRCTVSIGWTVSTTGVRRDYMLRVETAVAAAKGDGRDRVAMFDESMKKAARVTLRTDCAGCRTNFAFDIPRDANRKGSAHCPNCGAECERPPAPASAEGPQDITDLPAT